jgi:hypothetical protein
MIAKTLNTPRESTRDTLWAKRKQEEKSFRLPKSLSPFSLPPKLSQNKNKNGGGKYIGLMAQRKNLLSEQLRGLSQTSLYSCLEEDEDEASDHLLFLISQTSRPNEFEV